MELFAAALSQNRRKAEKRTRYGHENCIFVAPCNEIEYVLGIKESKFNGKIGQYSRAEGADVFL